MNKKIFKTILLVVGSGIGGILLFVASIIGYSYYQYYSTNQHSSYNASLPNIITTPPAIIERKGFLGSTGIYAGEFPGDSNEVLAAGQGKMIGKITANGKPVKGLRLRLALNGKVMSQWSTSDADGEYTISLPFGEYRIDGYELYFPSADSVLAGMIDNPRNAHSSEIMRISGNKPGRGLNLDYVDPVVKLGPTGEVSLSKPIIIKWSPYPGASSYSVQLIEQKNPRDYSDQRRLFNWSQQPEVRSTSINMAEHGIEFQKGYYYTVEIKALDEKGRVISQTAPTRGHPEFFIVE